MADNNYQAKHDRLKLIQKHLEIMTDRIEKELDVLDAYDEEDEGFNYILTDWAFELDELVDRLKRLPEIK